MYLSVYDWIILILFIASFLVIGVLLRKKASNTLADFFLGGRNLPWYIAGTSMVATTFAADTPLAVTEMVAENGIARNWFWWNMLIGGLLTTFFFAKLWRRAKILTELEFIELRYSGKAAAFLRGFKSVYLGIFLNVIIIGWVNVALITIIQVFFQISYTEALWITIGAMTVALIYSTISGLLGVAITGFIQFIVAMAGCIVLTVLVVSSDEVGGITGLKEKLPEGALDFFPQVGSASSSSDVVGTVALSVSAFLAFITVQWWASWYPGAEPGGGGYVAQRMMSAKNERHAVFSTLFFQIAHYCLRPWPWILIGLSTLILYPQINIDKTVSYTPVEYKELVEQHPTLEAKLQSYIQYDDEGNIFIRMKNLESNSALFSDSEISILESKIPESRLGFVYAMIDFLPDGLKGLLFAAFLAAHMSTVATQLNWGASFLTNDLYKRFIKKQKKFEDEKNAEKHYVLIGRLFTIIIMFFAVFATTQISTISGAWEFLIQCGAGLGLVLILRWYWWRINAWSEIVATLAPFVGFAIANLLLAEYFPRYFNDDDVNTKGSFFFTVGFTTIAWIVATFVTKPSTNKTLVAFYNRVKPNGAWGPIKEITGNLADSSNMKYLFISWFSSVGLVYSALFSLGKLILMEWTDMIVWLIVFVVSLVIFRIFVNKAL
jgi:solute:Na+ symporter, SSS family